MIIEQGPVQAQPGEQSRLRELDRLQNDAGEYPGPIRLVGQSGREYELPETVTRLLGQMIHALARGEAIAVVPVRQDLTTQEAADLINVSRQHLVHLLDRGDIRHYKVGTHRRVALCDLLDYKRQRDRDREAGFAELAQLSQDLGLYE